MKRDLEQLLKNVPVLMSIAQRVHASGGRVFLVGGIVRDLILCLPVKDVDLEVHGLEADKVQTILASFGIVDYVGKSFGVFKFFDPHLRHIDVSLPRADTAGRKPQVTVDPSMSITQAFRRRDLTINAMGIDPLTDELIDPFGGYHDLQNKTLRAVDADFFVQDPLRFYRVMQFMSRFGMAPDAQLNQICAAMDVSAVSIERIEAEFEKLLLKSAAPSLGIRWLRTIGRLCDIYPELAATVGVLQSPVWHPEGDVFEHTMQSVDAAAALLNYDTVHEKLCVLYAALCHDIGKATSTVMVNGTISSHGHERESARLAPHLLARITGKKEIIATVVKLVAHHMQPLQFIAGGAKAVAYKRLARALAPQATIAMVAALAYADRRGRNARGSVPLHTDQPDIDVFVERAMAAAVFDQAEEPVLMGRDLLEYVEPGPALGLLLKKAYEIQIEEGITDKELLKARVLRDTNQ